VGDGLSKVDTDHPVKEALGKEGAGRGACALLKQPY
jgi:hypothetical protein